MLTIKMSVGVAPVVNLRNPLHIDEKACDQRIYPSFETQGRHHQMSKTDVRLAPQKELMSSNFF